MNRRIVSNIAVTLVLLPAVSATASPFCESLQALAGQGDADITLPNKATQATCRTSLTLSGATDVHCHWTFDYRVPAAQQSFDDTVTAVAACLGPNAVQSTDQSVNHPDAYDLRMFTLGEQEFAVSLKDKGALQQTLVFVRIPQAERP